MRLFGCLKKYSVLELTMDKGFSSSTETVETTIGDLIEAITQVALEAGKSEQEGYELAALTLESILRKKRQSITVEN